jgi:transposase
VRTNGRVNSSAHNHRVGIVMARFVTAYGKSSKNDGNDAEAICEAVGRPNMRFVPVKSAEQQAILSLHRVRQGFIDERTATINRVPRQYSTGGKAKLGRITKRGDAYLRTLLVLGARAVLQNAAHKTDRLSRWAMAVRARRGYHRAIIAVAAKNARIIWALLARNQDFAIAP